MLRVGLTGGIASGKSAVADRLAEFGAVVIDADVLARDAVAPGTPGLHKIVARFGRDILDEDGSLDRSRLGTIVFGDAGARRDLEAIVHPEVRRLASEAESAADPEAIVVHVIPLLVETGQERSFDVLVVVDCEPEVQRDRLMARNGLSEAEADARIAAQAGREERTRVADVLIRNDGDLAALQRQVSALWRRLRDRRQVP